MVASRTFTPRVMSNSAGVRCKTTTEPCLAVSNDQGSPSHVSRPRRRRRLCRAFIGGLSALGCIALIVHTRQAPLQEPWEDPYRYDAMADSAQDPPTAGWGPATLQHRRLENATARRLSLDMPATQPGNDTHFSEADFRAVTFQVDKYVGWANGVIEADVRRVSTGKPIKGKYIVLETKNELANRLRAVISFFYLAMVSGYVLLTDISYQKDSSSLLSELFLDPGYQWDLPKLPPSLKNAIMAAPSQRLGFNLAGGEMERWACSKVLDDGKAAQVIRASSLLYPLPAITRNPSYSDLPLGRRFKPTQRRLEALETLLIRRILRPQPDILEEVRTVLGQIQAKAAKYAETAGLDHPPVAVGLHIRTYYVKALSDQVKDNFKLFGECAAAVHGVPEKELFYFVATDEVGSQKLSQEIWGAQCLFVDFNLPGRFLGGVKAALVDLLVMGSLGQYVMTPHSSFSELGAVLSFSHDPSMAMTRPNQPVLPLFQGMNDFERKKVDTLLNERGAPIAGSQCVQQHTAGLSLMFAEGQHMHGFFELLRETSCNKAVNNVAII